MKERDPENIVLNIDREWAFADGLHAGEREEPSRQALGPELHAAASSASRAWR